MVKRPGGLGRGLSALIGATYDEAGPADDVRVEEVPVKRVHPNPGQPRIDFDEEKLVELTDSVRQVGILQPILVRAHADGYQIIAGERRYQAACRAGLETVPVIVRDIDDAMSLRMALIENIQRANLNGIEEALAYRDLIDRTGITQEELAGMLSKSRSTVTNSLRLLELPAEVQTMVRDGVLSAGHARAILGASDEAARIRLAHKAADERLSVRQTEALVNLLGNAPDTPPRREPLPSAFKRAARHLRKTLGTGVRVRSAKGAYKIEIDVADDADLERLMGIIAQKG